MPENKTTKNKPQRHWLNIFGALFVLGSLGLAGYFAWQTYHLENQKTQLLTAIETQKQTLISLRDREKIGERMKAAEILNQAQKYRKNWSKAVKDLNTTFSQRGKIVFKSVSISPNGEVTVQATADSLLTAAGFLVLVNRSDKYEDAFISYISPQGNDPASKEYTFSATFNYLETDPA